MYLFLAVLTTSSVVACLVIYFCIFEKSKEYKEYIGEIEPTVLSLYNEFSTEIDLDKRFFMKYEDMLEIVEKCNNVSSVIVQYSMGVEYSSDIVLLRNKKKSQGASHGVSADYDKLMGLTIEEGRFIKEEDEESEVCVILQSLAKELDAKVSDTISYMGKELRIIGIVAEQKPFDINITYDDGGVYLPIKIKRQLHENEKIYIEEAPRKVSAEKTLWIVAHLINYPGKKELANQEVINLLKDKYGEDKKFSVGDTDTSLLTLVFEKILWTVSLLLIVGISILINIKSLSKLLLAYSNKNRPFLVETCLLTIIGGLLGVVFGGKICHYLMINPKISILSIFVSLSVVIVFDLLLAVRTVKKLRVEVVGW